ncbi:MAG: RNA polymerase sigma factor [Aggregatilineales bacterium]
MSDADLIGRVRNGDASAYDLLVQQHQQAVFRLAYLLLGDPADADDVAQETFIRAFRSLNRFDETRPLRPWLLQITANLARNHHRAMNRYLAVLQRIVSTDPDQFAPIASHDTPEDESQALWQTVRQLNRSDQEIIYLRYFLELSEAETAQTLAIAPGTVKSRLHRALGRLRHMMKDEVEGGSG